MHARVLLVPVFALGVSTAFAQQADTTNYFPLEVGNSWSYLQILNPGDPPVVIHGPTRGIDASFYVNDTLYYHAPHIFGFADTLRNDEVGRIWALLGGKDVLLFDFTLADGEGYQFKWPANPDDTWEVTVRRNRTKNVVAGHFEHCIVLQFDIPEAIDDEHSWAFALGVGIVEAVGFVGDYRELESAVIGGAVISSTEDDAPALPRMAEAYAYPNPFTFATTVVLPAKSGPAPTAVVYDILGRRVVSLTAGRCEPGQCEYRWDGSGRPAGSYYIVLDGSRGRGVTVVHR